MLTGGLASLIVLALTFWILPQVSSDGALPLIRLVVIFAVIGLLMRWVLTGVAMLIGSVGVLIGGMLSQFVVVFFGIRLDPGIRFSGGGVEVPFVVSVVMSSISALVAWIAYAGSDDAYLKEMLRTVRRSARRIPPAPRTGLLIIQLDGLSAPLLNWMVMSGNLPHLGGWIRTGSHSLVPWHTGIPSTTPASQAGILHRGSGQIPAFRWYEKESGRIIVTNRPRDAADIEERMSDGRGLLADGGASISNVFSGDAPTSLLTFSKAALPNGRTRGYVSFFSSPQGFARGLVLTIAEMVKELHQARRQKRLKISPRVHRGGAYVVLRAVSNVLLRDLNVSLITEQLVKGTPVIYCDFIDYDEVAHHAGPTRPEALQALEGLDRVVGGLQGIIDMLPHDYEIVILSDHGQSQGATFQQRYGRTLTNVVDELLEGSVEPVGATSRAEDWGPVNGFLTELIMRRSVAGSVTRRALRGNAADGHVELGPAECEGRLPGDARAVDDQAVVIASGNLAMVYLADRPGRIPMEELDDLHPRLVPGLAQHPGVGFVVVDTVVDGPVAIGRAGVHVLQSGRVEGTDPLAVYDDPELVPSLLKQSAIPHVGDVVVVSRMDSYTHEVAAFEELVGCHGGVGGWQTQAVLVHPSRWTIDKPLVGSDAVHEVLVGWLEELGQRVDPTAAGVPAEPAAVPVAVSEVAR
ncbi:alkaline phosphatase family protein [Kribbella sp. NBC_01245]|uniref:alkaline phosphatase family protein n=1 Tax=Kribbella sp. NBC_01245 TaxID=2903578 RepID=UPI002E2D490F|nr:alkaline phosphatase family protein [Kribbella sp. NBC_01245]